MIRRRRKARVDFNDSNEAVNYISECSKLAQKLYKSNHNWVGRVIHWELCKSLMFGYGDKCYVPKENEMPKILWD